MVVPTPQRPSSLFEEEKKDEMMDNYGNEEIDVDEIDVDDLEMGRYHRRQQRQSRSGGTKILICCPLTRQPLRKPVVHPKGETFELEAAEEQFGPDVCYPNRALAEYIEPTTNSRTELNANSIDKKGIFYCSITSDLLRDPVIDPEGNTFERHAIVDWIQQHGDSPITRNPLAVNQLYDNTRLLTVLMQEIQQQHQRQQQQQQHVGGDGAAGAEHHDVDSDDDDNEEINDWKNEVSRIPTVEPALTESQLEEALQPPPVPNPPLPVIREALGQQLPPEQVPDPSFAAIQQALGDEDDEEQQQQNSETTTNTNLQVNTARVAPSTTRTSTRSPSRRRSRRSSRSRSATDTATFSSSSQRGPQPLLMEELEQVQQDEQELRRSFQQADQHLEVLCHRHKNRVYLMVAIGVGFIIGLFCLTFFVADATFPISALVTGAVLVCCCMGMGQYNTCQ